MVHRSEETPHMREKQGIDPEFTYRMPQGNMEQHHCSTVVVSCIDFRFREANDAFIEKGLGEKNFDTLNYPGGGKSFASDGPERELLADKIEQVCVDLHDVKRIVIMNHWDCGGYGGSGHFHSPDEEEETYRSDLEKARVYLKRRFPNLDIVAVYNKLDGENLKYQILKEKAEEEAA